AAVTAFDKLGHICTRMGARLLLSGLSHDIHRLFALNGVLPSDDIRVFNDLDHGFEWIEEQLLAEDSLTPTIAQPDQPPWRMNDLLEPYFDPEATQLLRE